MLNVLFAGSPECSVPSLEAVARKHRLVAVLTNPSAPIGRSGHPVPTPVAQAAERLKREGLISQGTPILTPERIRDDTRTAIAACHPDIMVCFAYGKIFGPKTLGLFSLGAVNLHPSLLPRWRGSAPVPAAILAGDIETGITIQKMALEMDAGDILLQKRIPLDGTETTESLLNRVADEGAPLLAEILDRFEKGSVTGIPQNSEQTTFCSMLKKEDGEINWHDSAARIDARVRAFFPWPGTFTHAGERVLIIQKVKLYTGDVDRFTEKEFPVGKVIGMDKKEGILVQTGRGVLALERLYWQTKKPLDWRSFLNGARDFIGLVLGNPVNK